MANDVFCREERVLRKAQEYLGRGQAVSAGGEFCAELVEEYGRLFRHTRRMVGMGDRMQKTLNELNQRLAASEEKYRGIFENVVEGIFRSLSQQGGPMRGRLVEANPALAAMFGCESPEQFLARCGSLEKLFASAQERDGFARALAEDGSVRGFQAELTRPDGSKFWAQISASLLPPADGEPQRTSLVCVVADISERRRMLDEIYRLARTDSLTGLWNRGRFMDLARRELARARRASTPLSLIMVDADHFKRINDTHGHEAGDDALRCLARVLSVSVREEDLVARLGGEEFVVLLPGAELPGALAVAERIRTAIRMCGVRCRSGACFSLTVSQGVAHSQAARDTLEHLLRCADAALYAAKNAGRDRVELFEGAA